MRPPERQRTEIQHLAINSDDGRQDTKAVNVGVAIKIWLGFGSWRTP
jgi:hypothetical protein